jgi:hypothetical protein
MKRPAALNVGVDLDREALRRWAPSSVLTAPARAADLARFAPAATLGAQAYQIRKRPAGAAADPAVNNAGARSRSLFVCGDALECLEKWRGQLLASDLVYCDPPYLLSARRAGGQDLLYRYEMSDLEHRRLLRLLRSLPCMVLLSGYHSELYARELRRWNTVSYQSMTRRGAAVEFLWFNYSAPVALHDYRFLGADRREREYLKRKKQRWLARLERMNPLERQALLGALAEVPASPANLAAVDPPSL